MKSNSGQPVKLQRFWKPCLLELVMYCYSDDAIIKVYIVHSHCYSKVCYKLLWLNSLGSGFINQRSSQVWFSGQHIFPSPTIIYRRRNGWNLKNNFQIKWQRFDTMLVKNWLCIAVAMLFWSWEETIAIFAVITWFGEQQSITWGMTQNTCALFYNESKLIDFM